MQKIAIKKLKKKNNIQLYLSDYFCVLLLKII